MAVERSAARTTLPRVRARRRLPAGAGLACACAIAIAAALVAGCGGGGGQAPAAKPWVDPGEVSAGEWTLYYAASPSTDLDPTVARTYGVTPRARGGIVTVSLARRGDPKAAADASVTIAARTLLGQPRAVEVRRIGRDGIVSWLGEFEAGTRETLLFSVRARVPELPSELSAEFTREFQRDE